jgi:hypothetical protein
VNPPEIIDGAIEEDTLAGVGAAILARAKPGTPYPGGANRGGWKSSVDLWAWPEIAVQWLRMRIQTLLIERGFVPGNAWAVVNRNGSWHGRHRHGVPIMGIAFIASGDPPIPTVFEVGAGHNVEVPPVPGRIVLCGDLYHHVPVYNGSTPRIVVAFDGKRAHA